MQMREEEAARCIQRQTEQLQREVSMRQALQQQLAECRAHIRTIVAAQARMLSRLQGTPADVDGRRTSSAGAE